MATALVSQHPMASQLRTSWRGVEMQDVVTVPKSARIILSVVLALIVVGIGLWLINTYVPMAGSIKAILNIVVVVATCVGVLQAVGLWGQTVTTWNNLRASARHAAATSPAPTPDKPRSTET
jgi:predicted membrane protein